MIKFRARAIDRQSFGDRVLRGCAGIAALGLLQACTGTSETGPTPTVSPLSRVVITTSATDLPYGTPGSLQVQVTDAAGAVVTNATLQFTARRGRVSVLTDASTAATGRAGLGTLAFGADTVLVTATRGSSSVEASAAVSVSVPPGATLRLGDSSVVPVGTSVTVVPQARTASGVELPLDAGDLVLSSSDPVRFPVRLTGGSGTSVQVSVPDTLQVATTAQVTLRWTPAGGQALIATHPVRVPTPTRWLQVVPSFAGSMCAIRAADSLVFCMAPASRAVAVDTPRVVVGLPKMRVIAGNNTGGGAHNCGLAFDGLSWCWGNNSSGQMGVLTNLGNTTRNPPALVPTALRFVEIAVGGVSTCGRTAASAVWCWGELNYRQQAEQRPQSQVEPYKIDLPAGVVSLQMSNTSCAQYASTTVPLVCWNAGFYLMTSPTGITQLPEEGLFFPQVKGGPAEELTVTGYGNCARRDARVWCWNTGAYANGVDSAFSADTTAVELGRAWATVVEAGCGIEVSGALRCVTGLNSYKFPWASSQETQPRSVAFASGRACEIDRVGRMMCSLVLPLSGGVYGFVRVPDPRSP